MKPAGSRAFKRMRWLKERMIESGHPLKFSDNLGRTLRMGPLTVTGTTMLQMSAIRDRYADYLKPAPGTANVVVISARNMPDENPQAVQVVMSLESLLHIMQWLAESDPDRFLRSATRKGVME